MSKMKLILSILILGVFVIGTVLVCCIGMALFITLASDRVPTLVFLNHTGQDVTIIIDGSPFQVQQGKSIETPFIQQDYSFSVRTLKNEDWIYQWATLNETYYSFHDRIYLQIEPNGHLYVLRFQANSPVDQLPSQPVGFPLKPKSQSGQKNKEEGK
jgi:hypothetical protein